MKELSERERVKVSKLMSYILRHAPDKFELPIDEYGFAPLSKLVKAVSSVYDWVTEKHVMEVVERCEKGRFEIKDDKIRATYGHTIRIEKTPPEVEPPDILYHGTSPASLKSIMREGLKPMKRQYVHLSETREDAFQVGKRKAHSPVILRINAKEAYKEGIKFFREGKVYLTKSVPPKYILPEDKEAIREKIWHVLEEEDIADFPRPCFGRIPNFRGSREASERIKEIPEFEDAKRVFTAPDFVLKRIREIVLEEGKTLIVALPHMQDFLEINERERIKEATSIKGFKKFGKPISKGKIDIFVQGSVAVDKSGNRIGKGRGYGDREWDWLCKQNLISPHTKVVTLVHPEQIVEDISFLMSEHDKKVDYIITPSSVIKTF
ncbi:MAG: 5-formyltetrahydrofolate cyclo-ligase [Candidatus Methanospirareceae archaeon]